MPPLWLALSLSPPEASGPVGPVGSSGSGGTDGLGEPAPWLGAWALCFTPKVVAGPGVWLLEVSSTLRLWGGLPGLMAQMHASWPGEHGGTAVALRPAWQVATGPTALAALARWRVRQFGDGGLPVAVCSGERLGGGWSGAAGAAGFQSLLDLPLHTLDAARPHIAVLSRLGVHSWGQLHRLPRAGVARRWGHGLLKALDQALGLVPEAHHWLAPEPEFDMTLTWPHHLEHAQALMAPAQQLLAGLQGWLLHRQRGVLAWRWTWGHDPRRNVASHGGFDLHVAQPSQNLAHLTRLSAEHLARHRLAAPAVSLRLTTLAHAPCWPGSADWLRVANPSTGQLMLGWTELLERLSARLGDEAVSLLTPANDHRPEHMQQGQRVWHGQVAPALAWPAAAVAAVPPTGAAALLPTWLLDPPLALRQNGHSPCYQGELQLLAGPQRLEATHWPQVVPHRPPPAPLSAPWPSSDTPMPQPPAVPLPAAQRDYFVARSPRAGLLWVYRLNLGASASAGDDRPLAQWFLHGVFA